MVTVILHLVLLLADTLALQLAWGSLRALPLQLRATLVSVQGIQTTRHCPDHLSTVTRKGFMVETKLVLDQAHLLRPRLLLLRAHRQAKDLLLLGLGRPELR